MKLWIDDMRPAPEGYVWWKSVNEAKEFIQSREQQLRCLELEPFSPMGRRVHPIELIDIDHDAGDYASDGGDYINLLNWLEKTGRSYPIRIHSMNPVGVENMRRIIERNGWTEVY